jgi:hypothetical protein
MNLETNLKKLQTRLLQMNLIVDNSKHKTLIYKNQGDIDKITTKILQELDIKTNDTNCQKFLSIILKDIKTKGNNFIFNDLLLSQIVDYFDYFITVADTHFSDYDYNILVDFFVSIYNSVIEGNG